MLLHLSVPQSYVTAGFVLHYLFLSSFIDVELVLQSVVPVL